MRLCDVCMDPDPFKRQEAVATLEVHRLPGCKPEVKDLYMDICAQCLTYKGLLKLREETKDA